MDGRTRKMQSAGAKAPDFLARYSATLIVIEGGAEGSEYTLDKASVSVGRGPDVDLEFPDDAMSRSHAAFEAHAQGLRVRDLGSTNGTFVNDRQVPAAELKHGDRVKIGEHCFQLVLDERPKQGRTFQV